MAYISRKYIREKWDKLSSDIRCLQLDNPEKDDNLADDISVGLIKEIDHYMQCIQKELGR